MFGKFHTPPTNDASLVMRTKQKCFKLSRGEICGANFIPLLPMTRVWVMGTKQEMFFIQKSWNLCGKFHTPCKWCESGLCETKKKCFLLSRGEICVENFLLPANGASLDYANQNKKCLYKLDYISTNILVTLF